MAKPRNTRYCKDACRSAADRARRLLRPVPTKPTWWLAAYPWQARPHSRYGVIARFFLLTGLLLGGGLAFAYELLLADDPLVTATEAQLVLRRRPAGAYESHSQARFWLPLCDKGDPMCTSYIAGFVEMQNSLRSPFFCPGTLRVAEVEAIVVTRLRYLSRNAPHLLRYPMEVVASHVLEHQLPCETRIAQAGGDHGDNLAH
jgi:hypothetical protein